MASRGLSPIGNSLLAVCQEHRPHESAHHRAGQGPFRYDGRLDVGHDSRQEW